MLLFVVPEPYLFFYDKNSMKKNNTNKRKSVIIRLVNKRENWLKGKLQLAKENKQE